MINTRHTCSICGLEFSLYDRQHMANHDNQSFNNNVCVSRWKNGWDKNGIFLDAINLNENISMMKNRDYKECVEIFNCRLIWLKKNGYTDIAEYFESRIPDIKIEFNKTRQLLINEKFTEIESIKNEFIK